MLVKKKSSRFTYLSAAVIVLTFAFGAISRSEAGMFETQADQEAVLKDVRVDEKPGAGVPLDLSFMDKDGRPVKLRDYFKGVPVILTLNYYECPMLCPITFANFARTMQEMKGLTPGKDYAVVTVSINPDEDRQRTGDKAAETYKMVKAGTDPAKWWAFLYGKAPEIKSLADAVGYRYVQIGRDNFAHPSAMVVLTPDGKVSRYLYGISQDPNDVRLALTEAAGGKIGASKVLNQVLLFCYHYDPVGKKYALAATRLMKAGGAVTLGFLVLLISLLSFRGKRK